MISRHVHIVEIRSMIRKMLEDSPKKGTYITTSVEAREEETDRCIHHIG